MPPPPRRSSPPIVRADVWIERGGAVALTDAGAALLEQIEASDKWNFYQAKRIKESVLSTKLALIVAMGKTIEGKDTQKAAEYKTEMEDIKKEGLT